jgi:hypothetical protein
MGWSQRLPTTAPVSAEQINEVLDAIGSSWSKQPWGWSAECDISLEKDYILFSGAWYSFDTRLPEQFTLEAKERKLPVGRLGERDG